MPSSSEVITLPICREGLVVVIRAIISESYCYRLCEFRKERLHEYIVLTCNIYVACIGLRDSKWVCCSSSVESNRTITRHKVRSRVGNICRSSYRSPAVIESIVVIILASIYHCHCVVFSVSEVHKLYSVVYF